MHKTTGAMCSTPITYLATIALQSLEERREVKVHTLAAKIKRLEKWHPHQVQSPYSKSSNVGVHSSRWLTIESIDVSLKHHTLEASVALWFRVGSC